MGAQTYDISFTTSKVGAFEVDSKVCSGDHGSILVDPDMIPATVGDGLQ